MNAISIIQPWAWLIAAGYKDIENRSWRPNRNLIGQRIAIHASKKLDVNEIMSAAFVYRKATGFCLPATGDPRLPEYRRGGVIGTAVVRDIVTESASPWFFGPFGIVLDSPELWRTAVSYPGKLGLWNFPNDLVPEGVKIL